MFDPADSLLIASPSDKLGVAAKLISLSEGSSVSYPPAHPEREDCLFLDLGSDNRGEYWCSVAFDGRESSLWHWRSGTEPVMRLKASDAMFQPRPAGPDKVMWITLPGAIYPPAPDSIGVIDLMMDDGSVISVAEAQISAIDWGLAPNDIWFTDPSGRLVAQNIETGAKHLVADAGSLPRLSPGGDKMAFIANGKLCLWDGVQTSTLSKVPGSSTAMAWADEDSIIVVSALGSYRTQPLAVSLDGTAKKLPVTERIDTFEVVLRSWFESGEN